MYLIGILSSRGSFWYIGLYIWPLCGSLGHFMCYCQPLNQINRKASVTSFSLTWLPSLLVTGLRDSDTPECVYLCQNVRYVQTHIPLESSQWEESNEIYIRGCPSQLLGLISFFKFSDGLKWQYWYHMKKNHCHQKCSIWGDRAWSHVSAPYGLSQCLLITRRLSVFQTCKVLYLLIW